jgi:hypothetical protein
MAGMKSPITFKDRLLVLGIVSIICVSFILLDQIPFFNNIFDRIAEFMQTRFVANREFYSD